MIQKLPVRMEEEETAIEESLQSLKRVKETLEMIKKSSIHHSKNNKKFSLKLIEKLLE